MVATIIKLGNSSQADVARVLADNNMEWYRHVYISILV